LRGLSLQDAAVGPAVRGEDEIRFVAADEAGAGEDDRLQQVAGSANAADGAEVRADLGALAADHVAGGAGSSLAEEDLLSTLRVSSQKHGLQLGQAHLLL